KTISGTSASGNFTDSIAIAGIYWYGIHVIDQAGNVGYEPIPPSSVKVIVNQTTICQDSDDDGYDNCAIGKIGDDGKKIDCDDNEYWANPNGTETCDTIDNDCDNQIDENCDNDNDGYCNENMFMYRNNTMCPNTSFIFSGQTGDDCDDINSSINPGITEICGNGIDEDCDGILDNGCTCTEDWICADWSDCVSGMQTRTCMDNNNCGTTDDKPEEEQVCLSAAITDPNDGLKVAQDGMRIDCQAIALGGTGSYSYEWRDNGVVFGDNQNWQSLDPLTMNVGNHIISVQITDANSSVANDNITIEIVSAGTLTAQIQMWQTEFARDPKTQAWFAVQANGGTGPYTFIWHSDIEGDFSTEQWPMIDVSSWALGTHIITVAVTDNSAIPLTATDMINIEIVDMSLELFSPMEGDTFYLSENVHFHAVAQGGTQPYNYQWKSDEADISTEAFFQKDDLSLGLRTITVTVTDSSIIPLSITKQAHINIIPAPALTISITSPADNSVFDYNESISFRSTTEGGVGPYNYNWKSNIDDQLNTNEIFTKSDLSIGNHTITVTVNDKSGQTSAKFINITVNAPAPPTAVISGPANNSIFTQFDDTIIFQGSASGGTAPYTYKWSSNNDGDLDSAESFMKNDLSVNSHIITFSVTDANNTVDSVNISLTVNARVAPNNAKQLADYPAKIMFLISDENWQDVMGLVPLTTWTAQNSAEYASCKHPYLGAPNVCVYPSLIYHKEAEDTFDADSILYFIDQYNPTKIIAINNLPAELTGAINGKGLTPDIISPSDYLSYWQSYGEVVYVENNYELALLASTYASLRNAPLIIQGSSLDAPSSFSSKKVYTVGTVVCPGSASQCVSFASKQDLEDEYFDSTATDKVVLVNLGDLVITINGTFSSNYCSNIIQNLASKLSLSAPFLASAKHELIISTIKTNFNEVDTFLENKISGLPYMPEFLTIIASPNAIDMQYHNQIAYGSYPSTDQWHYARMNDGDDYLDLAVGRIVGASVSDVSGTIARTIFYQETLRNPDRLHVGHGMLYEYDPALVYSYGQVYSLLGYDATVAPDRTSSDDWKNEFYIQYHDHGGSGFAGILSGQIPKLDNTFILTTACLTCNFKICEDNWGGVPFCGYAMRKGAVGYFGSVDTSTGGTNVHSFITDIFTDQLPVGKAFQNSKNLRLAWYPVSGYANMPYETLIGDPTFILNTDYNFPPADFAITEINPSEIKYKITVPAVKVEIPQNIKDACVHPENVKPFYITSTGQCSCYNPMYPERVYFKIPYVQGFNPTQITSSNASILAIKTQNEKFYFVKLHKTQEPYFFSTASETAFTDFDITFTLSE
ncbi:MAG: MopE-related protein, partial [Patescibacteria group bacterium]|nr:MopE-related protein [Patescibacteria group bacterium]